MYEDFVQENVKKNSTYSAFRSFQIARMYQPQPKIRR